MAVRRRMVVALVVLALLASAGCGRPQRFPLTHGAGFEFAAYYDNELGGASRQVMIDQSATVRTIFPLWYRINANGSVMDLGFDADAAAKAKAAGVAIVPVVRNVVDGEDPAAALRDQGAIDRAVNALVELARKQDFVGINLNFDGLPADARPALNSMAMTLGNRLRQIGKRLVVTVPVRPDRTSAEVDAYDYRALSRSADFIILSAYDRHSPLTAAGPLAPLEWVQRGIAQLTAVCPANRVLLAVGAFGYDWPASGAGVVHYLAAKAARQNAAIQGVPVRFDAAAREATYSYDEAGTARVVWYDNTAAIAERIQLARSSGLYGVAYWRLAQEEADFWPAIRDVLR